MAVAVKEGGYSRPQNTRYGYQALRWTILGIANMKSNIPEWGETMTYSANAIANYFISKAKEENDQKLDLMKLLKLIYIAHGISLSVLNKPLINEQIEAWRYGPVVSTVYQELKYSGLKPIHEPIKGLFDDGNGFDTNTEQLLKKIWGDYKENTGIDLSNWSHDEGGPWYEIAKQAKKDSDSFYSRQIIPENKIKQYFEKLLPT
jgi:uncharacterized phage-associated protein